MPSAYPLLSMAGGRASLGVMGLGELVLPLSYYCTRESRPYPSPGKTVELALRVESRRAGPGDVGAGELALLLAACCTG